MEPVIIEMPTEVAVQGDIRDMNSAITGLQVVDKRSHEAAEAYLVRVKGIEQSVRVLFNVPKAKAHEAHKAICAAETKLLEPVLQIQKYLRGKVGDYLIEQRRKEDDDRRRLEAEARKREQDRLQAEAEAAELAGDTQAAAEILQEAMKPPTPTIHIESQIAKTAGVSHRTIWSADVVSLRALILYVGEHPELTDLLQPNMTALNGMARALKNGMNIPGVRSVSATSTAVRGDA